MEFALWQYGDARSGVDLHLDLLSVYFRRNPKFIGVLCADGLYILVIALCAIVICNLMHTPVAWMSALCWLLAWRLLCGEMYFWACARVAGFRYARPIDMTNLVTVATRGGSPAARVWLVVTRAAKAWLVCWRVVASWCALL